MTDVNGYKLEYLESGDTTWRHGSYPSNTSGTVGSLTCKTQYEFRVRARGDGDPYSTAYGSPSDSVSKTTSKCSLSPPTDLSLSIETDDDLELAFERSESPHYYVLELHRSDTQNGTYTRAYTKNALSSPTDFDDVTKGYWYKARGKNCRTSTRTGCGDWSDWSSEIELKLEPPTGLSLSIESTDDNDLNLTYTQSGESTHYYVFELHRSDTQNGTYTRAYTKNASSSPADFDDVTKGYWYKARGKNCRTSTRTGCGDWSVWSSEIEVKLNPPTGLSLSVEPGDDNDLDLAFIRSESPHHYQFELHRSATQNGTYTRAYTKNASSSSADFDDVTKGYWYKARGKNCRTSARAGCGDWSPWSPALELKLKPPTNLRLSVEAGDDDDLLLAFNRSESPHHYHFELFYSTSENGVYQNVDSVNFSSSPAQFEDEVKGRWYKVRGRNCRTIRQVGCGHWSLWSNSYYLNRPPAFGATSYSFSVSETASTGAVVGSVSAKRS